MEKIYEGISAVLDRYKAISMVVLVLILAFPIVTTVVMWAERVGYFGNVYQQEHALLKQLAVEQTQLSRDTLHRHDDLRNELVTNRGLIQNTNHYQLQTCINTGRSEEDRAKCLKRQ